MAASKPAARPASRAPLVRANEIQAEPLTYCVDPLLPKGMLAVLSGKDKRGKTLLAIEIAKAFLSGGPFLGTFPVDGKGPVACYLLDDPDPLTIDRLKTLGIYDHHDLYLCTAARADLSDQMKALADMAAEVKRIGAKLVVVDALYLFIPPGRDAGNDAARMRPVMDALNRLAQETGATVLLIAHDNKGGADVAGAYVIRASAKAILRLDLPRGAAEGEDGPLTSRRVLLVETKLAAADNYNLEIIGTRDQYQGWRCHQSAQAARTAETGRAVQAFLDGGGTGTEEEIAAALKRRREDVGRALADLVKAGAAIPEPRQGDRGRPAQVYRCAEFPSQSAPPKESGRDGNTRRDPLDYLTGEVGDPDA